MPCRCYGNTLKTKQGRFSNVSPIKKLNICKCYLKYVCNVLFMINEMNTETNLTSVPFLSSLNLSLSYVASSFFNVFFSFFFSFYCEFICIKDMMKFNLILALRV